MCHVISENEGDLMWDAIHTIPIQNSSKNIMNDCKKKVEKEDTFKKKKIFRIRQQKKNLEWIQS